jgi:hypothetical protein
MNESWLRSGGFDEALGARRRSEACVQELAADMKLHKRTSEQFSHNESRHHVFCPEELGPIVGARSSDLDAPRVVFLDTSPAIDIRSFNSLYYALILYLKFVAA